MPHSEFWPFESGLNLERTGEGEASVMQKQLGDMEGEVKEIQMELAALRQDRMNVHPLKKYSIGNDDFITEDKLSKPAEVSKLREDLIRAKNAADEERLKREKYERKLKDMEDKINGICCTGLLTNSEAMDSRRSFEGESAILKGQIRDLKDELEETRLTLNDKTEELQEYRVKYLQAQQQVEELKRQLEVVDYDNKQVSEQVQLEIQKMKMQFQEKLHELSPLPDLVKGAQIELQEAKQLQRLAEDSSQQLSNELQRVKEKLVVAVNYLNKEKADKAQLMDECKTFRHNLEEKEKECVELTVNLDDRKCLVLRLQEKLTQQENRFKEKSLECAVLLKDLDELRQETTKTLSRNMERAESKRRALHTQIAELERQLVQSRAQCRSCQKDRDEARQRIQIQLNNLQENFEMVEMRLRTLQAQVHSLKSTYAVILTDEHDKYELNKISS